jgi:HK97 family phage prohead protease
MDRIHCPLEIKSAKEDGTFSGYAAVFGNIDLGYDVIEPGAFKSAKTTADGQLRIAIDHSMGKLAGKATYKQDDHGLWVEGKLSLGVSYVKDVYQLMRDGVMDGLSVGFNILKDGSDYEERSGKFVRVIKAAELWEFSIVAFGMNPLAKVDAVKSIRDFEAQLRGLGYSQTEAKALASGGFKSLGGHRDGDHQDSAMLADALKSLKTHLTF